jgi:thymidylate kinase
MATARDTLLAFHCLSIGRDRSRRYARAAREARNGRVVLFDRFPLERLSTRPDHRLFDGPQIRSVLTPPLARLPEALAGIEGRMYRRFRLPDRLVMLEVDPDVAIARKPDHLTEVLLAKCAAFADLAAVAERLPDVEVSHIDANQDPEAVLAEIKRAVWDVI